MFEGIYIAIVTPFDDRDKVDHTGLARLCDDLITRGVHGLVPCGTTGESATLTHQEHIDVISTAVKAAAGRVPVIAGTGSNATAEAIELTQAAKDVGADAALLITPYYNKPTQQGLYEHVAAIAEATKFPLVLYNIPSRTSVDMSPETIARLAELPEVVGLKEATGVMTTTTDIRLRVDPGFTILAGDDAATLPLLALGGNGVISVVGQVLPEKMVALWDAWQDNDIATARVLHNELYPLVGAMFIETNPGPVKEALYMLGAIDHPDLRLPMTRTSITSRAIIRDALAQSGLNPQR